MGGTLGVAFQGELAMPQVMSLRVSRSVVEGSWAYLSEPHSADAPIDGDFPTPARVLY